MSFFANNPGLRKMSRLYTAMEPAARTRANVTADIRLGTMIGFIVGIVSQLYAGMKTRLESQNVVLQEAVQTRTSQLEQQEKELETAREIQAGLIPTRISKSLEAINQREFWEATILP